MYARVTFVQIVPGKLDEAVERYRDTVVPAAKQQKGCRGAYLLTLTDRSAGKGISMTLWETEADMIAGENSGYYQGQLAKFKDVFGAPPVREAYEVSVQA
jgi:heme-degrading monooxygenase HmoA